MITLRARYYSRFPGGGIEPLETHGRYETVCWNVSLRETALVCLDVWDRDAQRDLHAEDDRVTVERIVPVLNASRAAGLTVIHAPAPPIARRHANYVGGCAVSPAVTPWPPQDFRRRQGAYAALTRPDDQRRLDAWKALESADFHPQVRPQGAEPVIATGDELHRLCQERRLLHLVYVGFHTPGCMTGRNYGLVAMQARGYTVILLRDCTNGMETNETLPTRTCLRGSVAFLEQTGILTMTGDEFAAALATTRAPGA
ncbi:MAG TPA: isochorismatase family protein [Phycisphaerae bacterium]|nr:cysteine hydrolase [Phycisphaerae bacterium]HOI54761.1 isochorismatase family protein [Phycisphaerae bacterium]